MVTEAEMLAGMPGIDVGVEVGVEKKVEESLSKWPTRSQLIDSLVLSTACRARPANLPDTNVKRARPPYRHIMPCYSISQKRSGIS